VFRSIGAARIIRVSAAIATIGCLATSLMLLLKLGYLGFAVGAWKGLDGYEQAIIDARRAAKVAGYQLAAVQLFGGAFSFIAFRRGLSVMWSPAFIVGFCAATAIMFWLHLEIGSAMH
jgi:hypothetical protein